MLTRANRVLGIFESVIVVALQALIVLMIGASTLILFALAFENFRTGVGHISDVEGLLTLVQRTIAGVLTVMLGLEILETLKAYFRDHHIRLEVILVVAIIAVGRHLVQLDFEHSSPTMLFGLSSVILSLTIGFFLTRKALMTNTQAGSETQNQPRIR